ncbi:MAG: metalloprotease TldD, partial [Candidatus Accumulibacter sp.]|nr:metalloprotease TldD [Accumulibacter sp.]
MDIHSQSSLLLATKTLLAPYGLDLDKLNGVLDHIAAHEIDYADLYFQYCRNESWSLDEGIVKSGSFNIDEGVGVRAVSGEKTAFAYSDDISLPVLSDAASTVRAIAAAGQTRRVRVGPLEERKAKHALYLPHDPLASLDAAAKVRLLERLETFARAEDSRVT